MANLKKGENKVKADSGFDLSDCELNSSNCEVVIEDTANPKSWRPAKSLNSLTKITKGKKYIIRLLEDVNVSKL
jgi:hypothetical protein